MTQSMVLERISLLRNIGPFDLVDTGNQIPLTKLSLIYAENGRGKTTLTAILRSLSTGDARLINDRQRLGAQHPPCIVLMVSGERVVFEQGDWSSLLPRVAIFDDAFVAANVCSGYRDRVSAPAKPSRADPWRSRSGTQHDAAGSRRQDRAAQ